jgi:hypothetical protein
LVAGQYEKTVDRESAFEKLKARRGATAAAPAASGESGGLGGLLGKIGLPSGGAASKREGVIEAAVKSAARAMASEAGRRIIRGVLGSMLGGRR